MVSRLEERYAVHPDEEMPPPGAISRRPWRITIADRAVIDWMKARGKIMRRRLRDDEARVQADLGFLSRVAVRMRRRQRLNDVVELARQNEAAEKLQALWARSSGSRQHTAAERTKARSTAAALNEVLLAKFDGFCQSEYPALPFVPTLPTVVCKYARYLHAETHLGDPRDLAPHFEAINAAHREADYDAPCAPPLDAAAFAYATKRRTDATRSPPERRAPLHPRFVVRMLELAVTSPVEAIRRCCAFTVLSYVTLGRPGFNYSMRVEDVLLEPNGAVMLLERSPGSAFRDSKGYALLLPHRVWRGGAAAEKREAEALAKRLAAQGGGPADAKAASVAKRRLAMRSARHVSFVLKDGPRELSLRNMFQILVTTHRLHDSGEATPIFWLPKSGEDRPTADSEAAWVAEACRAALAYAPGGEKFNATSLRSGAWSAAHAVGVALPRVLAVSGASGIPYRDIAAVLDCTAEPSETGDFLFGALRSSGYALTEAQRALCIEDPARAKRASAVDI